MPVYIGDYLADTMHLSTEQHGAYLLLLFHLWRRGTLQDEDGVLAQITGLSPDAWSSHRAVLGEFFEIREGPVAAWAGRTRTNPYCGETTFQFFESEGGGE